MMLIGLVAFLACGGGHDHGKHKLPPGLINMRFAAPMDRTDSARKRLDIEPGKDRRQSEFANLATVRGIAHQRVIAPAKPVSVVEIGRAKFRERGSESV